MDLLLLHWLYPLIDVFVLKRVIIRIVKHERYQFTERKISDFEYQMKYDLSYQEDIFSDTRFYFLDEISRQSESVKQR